MADDEARFGILAAGGPTAASILKRALEDEGVQVLYFSDGSGKPETLSHIEINIFWSADAQQAEAAVGLAVLAVPAALREAVARFRQSYPSARVEVHDLGRDELPPGHL
jgi:hypothetical protein